MGCLVTSTDVILKRSVGLDTGQRLMGDPPGKSSRASDLSEATPWRALPSGCWKLGDTERALAAFTPMANRIVQTRLWEYVGEQEYLQQIVRTEMMPLRRECAFGLFWRWLWCGGLVDVCNWAL